MLDIIEPMGGHSLLDNEEVGTRITQREQNLSPFGQYLYVTCKLLGISENKLALASGISTSYFFELMRPPRKKSPSDETVAAVVSAVEQLARERGIILPDYWSEGLFCAAWVDGSNEHVPVIRRIKDTLLSQLILMAKRKGIEVDIPMMGTSEIRTTRKVLGRLDSYLRDIERSR